MEKHKVNSLMESLKDGEPVSEATLIALKRLNKKVIEWIQSLGDECSCLLCGRVRPKEEITLHMESEPLIEFSESEERVRASKFMFLACNECSELLEQKKGILEGWASQPTLKWQREFLLQSKIDTFIVNSYDCGQAKQKINQIEISRRKN